MGLLHPLLPYNVGPAATGPVLDAPRVQDEGHGQQGGRQVWRGAAVARSLAVVDVNATVILQVQALVETNRGAIEHAASAQPPAPSVGVSVGLVAARGLKL